MIRVISDAHMEFSKKVNFPSPETSSDYLFCAGDIGNPKDRLFKEFFDRTSSVYKQVFYVTGNHEYYGNDHTKVNQMIDEILPENCVRLDKGRVSKIELGEKEYNVVGCTLWSDVSISAAYLMNDVRKIYEDGKRIKVDNIKKWNQEDIEWLKEWFSKPCNTKTTIVMTHHLPSYQLVHDKFKHFDNSGFANEGLDEIIAKASL